MSGSQTAVKTMKSHWKQIESGLHYESHACSVWFWQELNPGYTCMHRMNLCKLMQKATSVNTSENSTAIIMLWQSQRHGEIHVSHEIERN